MLYTRQSRGMTVGKTLLELMEGYDSWDWMNAINIQIFTCLTLVLQKPHQLTTN